MDDRQLNVKPVSPSQRVDFRCTRCGACCRHLRESVPLNTLDAFRLAKHLRAQGEKINCLDSVFARFAEPVPLHESGYSVYMLKTAGPDDACIFLQNNRCTIQPAKPSACRLYPFAVEPKGDGLYTYLLSMEKPHHFKGRQVQARRWMKENFPKEDREFLETDLGTAPDIVRLLMKIPEAERQQAWVLFLWYKYANFDLDRPFWEQYRQNMAKLLAGLNQMTKIEKGDIVYGHKDGTNQTGF
ncbi:YkgJ family cysteine cluster protein [Acutalibacter muris]|uniref:YkgJ family cysteine cluster protein n=1 Tax=Acutalibacter muris TaxID=1796620 RepID=UPI00272E581A|nr:YkgJ family cysteine cluster protein [Acutalibacter muris]